MKWNEIISYMLCWLRDVLIVTCVLVAIFGLLYMLKPKEEPTTSPVEKEEIDSIVEVNAKLIIEVKTLDSIKNAKVIEIENLDNDSTLKLFYQLIGK